LPWDVRSHSFDMSQLYEIHCHYTSQCVWRPEADCITVLPTGAKTAPFSGRPGA
jgi:hypothetical protein